MDPTAGGVVEVLKMLGQQKKMARSGSRFQWLEDGRIEVRHGKVAASGGGLSQGGRIGGDTVGAPTA
jgi:hypothetical protein